MKCSSCQRDLDPRCFTRKDYTQNKNGKYPLARGRHYWCKECCRNKERERKNAIRIARTDRTIQLVLKEVTLRMNVLERRVAEIEKRSKT